MGKPSKIPANVCGFDVCSPVFAIFDYLLMFYHLMVLNVKPNLTELRSHDSPAYVDQ